MVERISEMEGASGRGIDRIRVCCQTVFKRQSSLCERLRLGGP
jgi:hypothetical protein